MKDFEIWNFRVMDISKASQKLHKSFPRASRKLRESFTKASRKLPKSFTKMDSCSVSQKWTLYLKRHVIKAPSARIHFEKFAFPFHWKWNKSIASTRSFSDHPFTRKRDKWLKTLSTFYCACLKSFLVFGVGPISYPEPSNFLQRMLDENEGLWKGPVLKVRK